MSVQPKGPTKEEWMEAAAVFAMEQLSNLVHGRDGERAATIRDGLKEAIAAFDASIGKPPAAPDPAPDPTPPAPAPVKPPAAPAPVEPPAPTTTAPPAAAAPAPTVKTPAAAPGETKT